MFGKKLQRLESIDETDAKDLSDYSVDEGISLEELSNAYAIAMHSNDSTSITDSDSESAIGKAEGGSVQAAVSSLDTSNERLLAAPKVSESDGVAITMEGVLEAILFMGSSDSNPIGVDRLLSGFRSVTEQELERCVDSLNNKYQNERRALRIVRERGGYRMTLTEEMEIARQAFYGKIKEVHLQQPAIDCLALIAYNQGISREELDSLWGNPSASQVQMLIRKDLVRCERSPEKQAMVYYTTDRFLEISDLGSLQDLPREEL